MIDIHPGAGESAARDINSSGQVVGLWWNEDNHAFLYEKGTYSGLEILGLGVVGGIFSAINELGQISGRAYTTLGEAMIYREGTIRFIDPISPASAMGFAINNLGHVAGQATDSQGIPRAFFFDGTSSALISDFFAQDRISGAFSLNDHDDVVGQGDFAPAGSSSISIHAFLFARGEMKDLGTLGGNYSSASDINNLGQIVGSSARDAGGESRAFLYESGQMFDLNTLIDLPALVANGVVPEGGIQHAEAINDSKVIIGWSQSGDRIDAFLLTPPVAGWITSIPGTIRGATPPARPPNLAVRPIQITGKQ